MEASVAMLMYYESLRMVLIQSSEYADDRRHLRPQVQRDEAGPAWAEGEMMRIWQPPWLRIELAIRAVLADRLTRGPSTKVDPGNRTNQRRRRRVAMAIVPEARRER